MLRQGFIKSAPFQWASSVVIVLKKDVNLGFCVNYRRLNAMTIRNTGTYFIPKIDECLDSLEDVSIITTMNYNSGY